MKTMAVKDVIIGEMSVSESPSGKGDVFLTVEQDGNLRYFCYFRSGENDPTGSTGFHTNSGNTIGRGCGLQHIVGVGADGIFLVVDGNGILKFFRYTGTGTHDPTGSTGFAVPGNQIGNGWNELINITAYPFFGVVPHQIFAIDKDGRMGWFGYKGSGEEDVDATITTNWHEKSHHLHTDCFIGNGWSGQQFVVAGGGAHFVVPTSGSNKGNLLFFRYTGV